MLSSSLRTIRISIAVTTLLGILMIYSAPAALAGGLKFGSSCTKDSECAYGNCEKSSKLDGGGNNKYFCDCASNENCSKEFGEPTDSGTWVCKDGASNLYDLDYCISTKKNDHHFPIEPADQGAISSLLDAVLDADVTKAKLYSEVQNLQPKLEIRIPDLNFSATIQSSTEVDGKTYMYMPWIGQYIAALYKLSMIVVSIMAVAMLIKSGFDIEFGGEFKEAGMKRIPRVIAGLLLVWGSYAIMYYLNPEMVQFKVLKVRIIEKIPLELAENETEEAADPAAVQPGQIQPVIEISGGGLGNAMLVGKDIAPDLKAAAAELVAQTQGMAGGPFKLAGGGYRPLTGDPNSQVEKWARQCEGKPACGTPVCNPFPPSMMNGTTRAPGAIPDPTRCPHTSGLALDIYCKGGNTEHFYAPCQRLLEQILEKKGFCRLTSEPWHFERPRMSTTCTNITGTATRKKTNQTWDYTACNGTYTMKTMQCS